MGSVYIYAVSYDLGFAPNPFGGLCSLACCKPQIRDRARLGDWIIGLTGTKIPPALRCVFGMVVTGDTTFDDYWAHPDFATRRPKRNVSPKKQVGDNIYHRDAPNAPWVQEDSVHSRVDGSQCELNTYHDTRVNRVLLSERFVYFGAAAPLVPAAVLKSLYYDRNPRDYCRFDIEEAGEIIAWLTPQMEAQLNQVIADPINFASSSKRFSAKLQRMI
jgi:hypothetical protein